jgi:hypothetical protein
MRTIYPDAKVRAGFALRAVAHRHPKIRPSTSEDHSQHHNSFSPRRRTRACGDGRRRKSLRHGRQYHSAQKLNSLDQLVPALDNIDGAGVCPSVLVYAEIGIGGGKQGVVFGGLDVEPTGIQDLPRRQGRINGIGHGDDQIEGAAAIEVV